MVKGNLDKFKNRNELPNEAICEIVDNLFVEPNEAHVRLLTRAPKGLNIVQVLVKISTEHRFLQSGNEDGPSQDIALRIVETQDLIVSTTDSNEEVFQAHCAPLAQMVKQNRQWCTASLVSPRINTVLKSNDNLEPGLQTQDWSPIDLFGDDAKHLFLTPTNTENSPLFSRNLATSGHSRASFAIGPDGIGSLVRLAGMVVENIDAVGVNNMETTKPSESSIVPMEKPSSDLSGQKRGIW